MIKIGMVGKYPVIFDKMSRTLVVRGLGITVANIPDRKIAIDFCRRNFVGFVVYKPRGGGYTVQKMKNFK